MIILSSDVEKSQETRWQNGIDIPEGESLTAYPSGSKLRPRQTCEGSVSPTQSNFPAVLVLTEPLGKVSGKTERNESGEARESTKEASPKVGEMPMIGDSRGGGETL